jgi:hypothetical protein
MGEMGFEELAFNIFILAAVLLLRLFLMMRL